MTGALGCVLAIRNRSAEVLERTFQTYAYQSIAPEDRLLLDYGSEPEAVESYRHLCRQYGWRLVVHAPDPPRWSLSDAYNRAVSLLDYRVEIVFKSDIDVLLGQDVLEIAATLGRAKLCLFSCLTTRQGASYPERFTRHGDLIGLLNAPNPTQEMPGESVHAFPRRWFEEIGGYDLKFEGWGFEDSDLRERAKSSIGIRVVPAALLVHQWHPRSIRAEETEKNRAYYDRMKHNPQPVRNRGVLNNERLDGSQSPVVGPAASGSPTRTEPCLRVAVVTRSMNDHLYDLSGELLGIERLATVSPYHFERHRQTGTDSLRYFRELPNLDPDWVVNLDEDAFLLHPDRLLSLIQFMDQNGFAGCGMPDGGVVSIRQHNPVACNAFFNVFDMRRVRSIWREWDCVCSAVHKREYERGVADFARRTPFVFDHFERYYGVFFSLLEAGERILYLDAEDWQDNVSTLLKDQAGDPLLIHCWYSRHWHTSHHTRRRFQVVIDHARHVQRLEGVNPQVESNAGKWDILYLGQKTVSPYGDTLTYEKAANYLGELGSVEDWGCGWSWFRKYLKGAVRYKGVDGSLSPAADEVVDLTRYTSRVEGILLRHVLEHNAGWERILANALKSFTQRMVLVLFTPFSEKTHVIRNGTEPSVPDISFAKEDLTRHFKGLVWRLEEGLRTKTQYGVEHVFYLERPGAKGSG